MSDPLEPGAEQGDSDESDPPILARYQGLTRSVQALCFESQTDIIKIRHFRSSIFPAGMEIQLE